LRTHIILALGAALAMCISIGIAYQYTPHGDPGRLAAQVISGIGFLGAGAILRYGTSVKGLTTASSLWTVAIIGLAVGAGYYFPAIVTTALLLGTLQFLDLIEKRYFGYFIPKTVSIKAKDRYGIVDEVKQTLASFNTEIKSMSLAKDLDAHEIEIEAVTKISNRQSVDKIFFALSSIKDVRTVEVQ
jgi:putative Mg2+ transporter-C (MgtC) family protein